MNKKSYVFFVLLLCNIFAHAEKFTIAPLVIYDQNNAKIEIRGNPQKEIYEHLKEYWFKGLLSFDMLKESEYGNVYTILDANKVCTTSKSDYLMYGYIQKNETSWYANLKIYSLSEYKIKKEAFATDAIDKYDRFINTLTSNIIDELNEISGNDINEKIQASLHPVVFKIPTNLYYWTPVQKNWFNSITGVIGTDVGFEFYPPIPQVVINSYLMSFSAEIKLAYSFAFGKQDLYPLNYHTFQIITPIYTHINFNEQHSMFFGIGPYYELSLLNIVKKYEPKKLMHQNMLGFEFITGYEFKINDLVNLRSEIDFDTHFSTDKFLSIKSAIGVNFKILENRKND